MGHMDFRRVCSILKSYRTGIQPYPDNFQEYGFIIHHDFKNNSKYQ
jgi:hypothetical protein